MAIKLKQAIRVWNDLDDKARWAKKNVQNDAA
jgi:hypothetical protein